jgi:hypothetical protein
MSDLSAQLDALRETPAGTAAPIAFSIEAFRADFDLVWGHWINCQQETDQSRREAGRWVQQNMHDKPLIECAANHFRQMASDLRASFQRDRERSERVKAEVRADRIARTQ